MSTAAPLRGKRGGFGKYLRARGRRGAGRPAEFGKRLVLEGEEDENRGDGEDEDDADDEHGEEDKYARRQLGTNADRYEEPEVDLHAEQEPEPEVDLSFFLERQRLAAEDDYSPHESDDDVDHTLSHLPSTSASNIHKKNIQNIQWDSSLEELKREKDAAEAVWDLKSRFRKNQPRLMTNTIASPGPERRVPQKIEDARHVTSPDLDANSRNAGTKATSKNDLENFLDDLLS